MQIRLPTRYVFAQQWRSLLFTLILSGFPFVAEAQTLSPESSTSSKQVKVPRLNLPGRRESGGTRTPEEICISGKIPLLKLLIPQTNVGFTTAAYPRFFWYAPDNTAQQTRFSLYQVDAKLRQRTLIYEQTLQPISQSGISSFSLPKEGKTNPLAINQNYLWSVSIICDRQDNSPKSVITSYGWVRRVGLDKQITGKLSILNQRDRLSVYSQQGLWFDFLTTLADLRACEPDNRKLSEQWQQTLTQVSLQSIAQEKLLDVQTQSPICSQTTNNSPNSQPQSVKPLVEQLRSVRNIQE